MKGVRHKRLFLIPLLLFPTVLLIGPVCSAEEKTRSDWTITLGLGAFHGPEYEGSDEAETVASPNIEVAWRDRIFLNPDGLSINYYENDTITLDATVSQGDERKESLSASLNGLGDIDASTTLTLGAEFELGLFMPFARLTKHDGGTDGIQAIVGVETALPLRILTGNLDTTGIESMEESEALTLIGPFVIAGLSVDWADDDYNSSFFGVDAEQSARSGLPQYTAHAGFKSVNLELGVLHHLNKSWSVQGVAGYKKLIGDAKDSPIVRDDDNVIVGGFINYHF